MHLKVNEPKEKELVLKDFMYISLTPEIYKELIAYVDAFDKECSGCGLVKQYINKFNDHTEIEYRVSKLFFPVKQSNTKTSTDIEGDEIGKIVTELVQNNQNTEELRLHWHSHNDMSVFHSGTDNENYNDLKTGDFLVSIVANKKRELLGRVDYYKPFNVVYNNLPIFIQITTEDNPQIEENIKKVKAYEEKQNKKLTLFSGNMYKSTWQQEDSYLKDNGRNHKDNKRENLLETPTGYSEYTDIKDEILALCYESIEALEYSGEIEMLYDNQNSPIGFRKIADNSYYQLNLLPLCKTEIEYYQKGE